MMFYIVMKGEMMLAICNKIKIMIKLHMKVIKSNKKTL